MARRDHEGITTLTLASPPINALDHRSLAELDAGVRAIGADVRVVVIASGIAGIFCAGGDLKYWQRFPHDMARAVSRAGREVFERIEQLPQPTIAALDGHVVGDGLALALAADLRVASRSVTFRVPEAEYGFIPGWGTIGSLRRHVGSPAALEMVLTGRPIGAEHARTLGLVTEVAAPGEALARAMELAGALVRKSPRALAWAKRAVRGTPRNGDDDRHEEDCFAEVWGSDDWREGIDALLDKRPPVFRTPTTGPTAGASP